MVKKWNSKDWAEAKKRCRLNEAEIQMAKELGITPKGLIKVIPEPNQHWKAPVKVWIRELYQEKFGRVLIDKHTKKVKKLEKPIVSEWWDDEDLPF
ncbi:MAG: hypothetical protein ABF649_13705 [Bacillus sp. (in: firmicutes)]